MLNISIRQMRGLVAIRKHGKISTAASELGLTSPAVTIQLQQLEEQLGTQLFLRTRNGAIATESGEIAIEAANRIINEIELLDERLREYKGLKSGKIRLGVVSTGKYFAPKIMAAFSREFPGIEISLFAANRTEIVAMLHDHDVDVALMGRPPNEFGVHSMLFGDHPLVFIAHPDNPLAGRRDIFREDLKSQKFIVRERGSGTRASFELFMSDSRGDPDLAMIEMDSNETIKQAVMAGLGIAFISGHTIEQETKVRKLVVLDVEETPIRRLWYSVRRADRIPTPAMLSFDSFLKKEGAQLLPVLPRPYPASSLAE